MLDKLPQAYTEKLNLIKNLCEIDRGRLARYFAKTQQLDKTLDNLNEFIFSLFEYRYNIKNLEVTTNFDNTKLVVKFKCNCNINLKYFSNLSIFIEYF